MKTFSPGTGERLRIAHLTTVDMSLALLLATELQVDKEAGHEVFGISAAGPYVDRVEALGVQHVPIKFLTRRWNLRDDAAAFFELFRTLRRLKLDVLHTHNPKTGVMGRIAGRLAGIPVVVNTCHGLWARAEDPLLKRLFVIGLEGFAARFSDFELFQNDEDARTLRRFLTKDRWRVVGNGVDLTRFVPDPQGRRRVRAELGVADDEVLVGTIGRRVREKGLAEYAAAAHALGARARFIWVGTEDGTDRSFAVPHQDKIQFVGERTDMPAIYAALDIFALASYREGFSRASMEAAACGKPMALADIRGCREIGTHQEHLLLVRPQDAPSLTAAIAHLVDDPAMRSRLGAAARTRALGNFDQREIARTSLGTYAKVSDSRAIELGRAEALPRRVRVLHVLPHDQNRGAQMYAGQLRDELRGDLDQEHLLLTVFASPPGGARPDLQLDISVSPLRRALDPRAVRRLRRVIRAEGIDVVIAHGGEALKYSVPAAGKIPVVYYKVGLSTTEIIRRTRALLYATLARRATCVVGVSEAIAEQVQTLFGVPADRLLVIPNGRDPEIYHPGPGPAPGEPPLLLWIGQLETGKRPELFIAAIGELRARGVACRAAIVGDGSLAQEIRQEADAASIELLGRREDVPDLLRNSSVVVMTSAPDTEGMPGVLIEAALSSIPVVATHAAGVSDVVQDGKTGCIVKDQASDIALCVADLLSNRPRCEAMAESAREGALGQFTIKANAARWRDVVEALTETQRQRKAG